MVKMGYTTDYYGTIKLSSKEIEKKLESFIKEAGGDWDEYFDLDGIGVGEQKIEISGYGKLYENELEKFCLFIARVDKDSSGEIRCKGEESDDFWRIVIYNGRVIIEQGSLVYDKEGIDFSNNKVNKDIYKATKDKSLLKELIVEELGDG